MHKVFKYSLTYFLVFWLNFVGLTLPGLLNCLDFNTMIKAIISYLYFDRQQSIKKYVRKYGYVQNTENIL